MPAPPRLFVVVSQGMATLLCCQERTSCGQPFAVSVPVKMPLDQLPDHVAKVDAAGDEVEQELAAPQELEEVCPTKALQLDVGSPSAETRDNSAKKVAARVHIGKMEGRLGPRGVRQGPRCIVAAQWLRLFFAPFFCAFFLRLFFCAKKKK